MKALSIIYVFVLTIAILVMTMWQIAIESPTFVIVFFFVMSFLSIYLLCKTFEEFYEKDEIGTKVGKE